MAKDAKNATTKASKAEVRRLMTAWLRPMPACQLPVFCQCHLAMLQHCLTVLVQLDAARKAAQASLASEPSVEWVDRFNGQPRKGCDILVQVRHFVMGGDCAW
jgi:hypothetical protein